MNSSRAALKILQASVGVLLQILRPPIALTSHHALSSLLGNAVRIEVSGARIIVIDTDSERIVSALDQVYCQWNIADQNRLPRKISLDLQI